LLRSKYMLILHKTFKCRFEKNSWLCVFASQNIDLTFIYRFRNYDLTENLKTVKEELPYWTTHELRKWSGIKLQRTIRCWQQIRRIASKANLDGVADISSLRKTRVTCFLCRQKKSVEKDRVENFVHASESLGEIRTENT
jgi:hypothetical protein